MQLGRRRDGVIHHQVGVYRLGPNALAVTKNHLRANDTGVYPIASVEQTSARSLYFTKECGGIAAWPEAKARRLSQLSLDACTFSDGMQAQFAAGDAG
jgi:hypothetical protein